MLKIVSKNVKIHSDLETKSEFKEMPIIMDDDGKPKSFFHGTDKKFEDFEIGRPGVRTVLFTEFPTTSNGLFFTDDQEFAREYGRRILERNLDVNNILLDPKEYPRMGVDSFPEDFEEELRYILEPMIEEEEYISSIGQPRKVKFIDVGVSRRWVKDDDWIYELVGRKGLVWDALDNPEVVKRMKERGYDATYVQENDGQTSIFVLNPKQVIKPK